MKTRTWMLIAGLVLAVGMAIALAPAALAQGPGGGNGRGPMSGGNGRGPMSGQMGGNGRGQMGGQQSLVAVAAQQLGMQQAELVAQLQGGTTIAQVAAEKHVALDTIVDAFAATRQARMAQAVAAGRLTQAEADARLATLRANVTARLSQPWSPQGPGAGAGYTDADGDGQCDYAGAGRMGGRWNQ